MKRLARKENNLMSLEGRLFALVSVLNFIIVVVIILRGWINIKRSQVGSVTGCVNVAYN